MPGLNQVLPDITNNELQQKNEDQKLTQIRYNRLSIHNLKKAISTLDYLQSHPQMSKDKQNLINTLGLLFSLGISAVSGYFWCANADLPRSEQSQTINIESTIGTLMGAVGVGLSLCSYLNTNCPSGYTSSSVAAKFETYVLPVCQSYNIEITETTETSELIQALQEKLKELVVRNRELGDNYGTSQPHTSIWSSVKKIFTREKQDEETVILQRQNSFV